MEIEDWRLSPSISQVAAGVQNKLHVYVECLRAAAAAAAVAAELLLS